MTENPCTCGCGVVTTVTEAEEPCRCGCECCVPAGRSSEEEIAQLQRLVESAEARLDELQAR